MPDFNFRHATFKQTLVYAKLLSRMTNEEISEASGISLAQVARYFQENDAYSPAPALVPALCRAMRNTVLVDWQNAQVEDLRPVKAISNVQDPPWLSRAHGKQDGGGAYGANGGPAAGSTTNGGNGGVGGSGAIIVEYQGAI